MVDGAKLVAPLRHEFVYDASSLVDHLLAITSRSFIQLDY